MSYVVIENFRGGLDTRRFLLTAQPGTLQVLENAHITRGGEIEKRKAFVSFAELPADTFDLLATADGLTVFGSVASPVMPSGITYQRLQHPDGEAMTGVRHSNVFNGRAFVIAEFANGDVFPYYNGELVTDFTDGIATAAMSSNNDIAEMLKDLVDASDDYSATRTGAHVDITGPVGEVFTVATEVQNAEGGTDDQTLTPSTTQVAVAAIAEVKATTSFTITAGTSNPGVNMVTSVLADAGVQILGANVDWATSNSVTAANVAAQINLNVGTHGYTATSSGAVVTVSAPTGAGAAANGRTLAVTATGVTTTTPNNFSGGVTAEAGQAQISRVTVGGTFEAGDKFTITLTDSDGVEQVFGAGRVAGVELDFVLTLKSKLYAISGSTVYFSAVNDATAWNAADTGSGFINMANNFGTSEDLVSLGVYQGNLAVFSRQTAQIWFVDPDPTLNSQLQVLPNIGTESKLSVVSYGESDSFFLADSGIRSLRARDSSNSAAVNDIGTPIDEIVLDLLAELSVDQKNSACAVIEPRDGRYWLAAPDNAGGSTVFVFSYFPSSKIVAWSTYAVPFEVERFAEVGGRVYFRSGDGVYLYGGLNNAIYRAPGDEFGVTVELPYLDATKPATEKSATGMDMAAEGEWEVELGMDPLAPTARDLIGTFDESTFSLGRIDVSGRGTHFGFRLTCDTADYARLANLIFHYNEAKAS